MIRLIDRLTGAVLGEVSQGDMTVLQEILEEEDENDTDYYLNATTLELLSQAGLSSDALEVLSHGLSGRDDLDFGWESAEENGLPVSGRVLAEHTGAPVPGRKVEVTAGGRHWWAFSRSEGSFEIWVAAGPGQAAELRAYSQATQATGPVAFTLKAEGSHLGDLLMDVQEPTGVG